MHEETMCQPGWSYKPQKGMRRLSMHSQSEESGVLLVNSQRARCGRSPSGGSLLENKNKAPGPTNGTPLASTRVKSQPQMADSVELQRLRERLHYTPPFIYTAQLLPNQIYGLACHTHTHTLSKRITLSRSLYSALKKKKSRQFRKTNTTLNKNWNPDVLNATCLLKPKVM